MMVTSIYPGEFPIRTHLQLELGRAPIYQLHVDAFGLRFRVRARPEEVLELERVLVEQLRRLRGRVSTVAKLLGISAEAVVAALRAALKRGIAADAELDALALSGSR
jgi:hypothetical protein